MTHPLRMLSRIEVWYDPMCERNSSVIHFNGVPARDNGWLHMTQYFGFCLGNCVKNYDDLYISMKLYLFPKYDRKRK